MALFSITRYMGDDDHSKSTSAADILQKLHNKAKQKRLSLPATTLPDETQPSGENSLPLEKHLTAAEDGSDKKRKKKRKIKAEDAAASSAGNVDDAEEPTERKKKKKRHKSDNSSATQAVEDVSVGIESSLDHNTSAITEDNDSSLTSDPVPSMDAEDTSLLDSDGEVGNADEEADEQDKRQQTHSDVGGFTVIGHVKSKSKEKVVRVLPDWLAKPSVITADIRTNRVPLSDIPEIDADLVELLKKNGISDFFPVQGQVIPAVLRSVDANNRHILGSAGYRPCDVCCSAPTGSGKTLTYVLPVVQCLRRRVVRQVRALVILPVIDLAAQVYKVFQTYCAHTDLKVGLAVGQKTFTQEQQMLVKTCCDGFESSVDILVATPSRVVDHISKTRGLDLTHLRFLVIDEADRMMEEFKHNWLSHVEEAVYGVSSRRPPGMLNVTSACKTEVPLQKLLFSATLSQNPEKLQQMRLFHPRLFTAVVTETRTPAVVAPTSADNQDTKKDSINTSEDNGSTPQAAVPDSTPVRGEFVGKFTTPAGLTEYFVESSAGEKPLVVLYLLHTLKFRRVLCFTNSLEATHRLFWLVKLVGGIEVREFSSSLPPSKRSKLLKKFTAGKIDMLICSDAMARGMDVDIVQCVISYELPPYLRTYIHRVGRTARAGRAGTAITLLEKKQIAHFKRMLKEAGKTGVKEKKLRNALLKPYVSSYQQALRDMPDLLKAERKKQRQK